MQVRKKMPNEKKLSEFTQIRKLWKGNEENWLRFYEIKREMEKQG